MGSDRCSKYCRLCMMEICALKACPCVLTARQTTLYTAILISFIFMWASFSETRHARRVRQLYSRYQSNAKVTVTQLRPLDERIAFRRSVIQPMRRKIT